jgi:phospholipid transport system substrate-binding protein
MISAPNKEKIMQGANMKKIVLSFLIFLLLLTGGVKVSTAQEGPLAQIRQTVDEIMAILNDERLAQADMREERDRRVMAEVRNRFNFEEMSRLTLTRNWRDLSPAEQEHFADLFANLLKNTYISRVEAYYQQQVKVVFKDEAISDGRAMVASVVIANGTETPIGYRLSRENGKWMVYDVVIEGVSLVRNYRTQFTRIIEKEKFSGLIRRMEEKIKTGETS